MKYKTLSCLAVLLFVCFPPTSWAGDLDTMGVTLLRASHPDLTGSNIPVAQAEALDSTNEPAFEVSYLFPYIDEPESAFTWISTNGSTNVFPNNLGVESTHADLVGSLFYSSDGAGMAPGVAHIDNYEADYFYSYIIETNEAIGGQVVNQSFAFFAGPPDEESTDSAYDDYIYTYGNIFASAPNNTNDDVGPPGTAYNCIGVGAYGVGADITKGPTLDNGRSKPDIVAPGQFTSFTTPYVAGAAAILLQAAADGDGGANISEASNVMTIKALLLNGALKPYDWTHTTNAPLDTRYGAGVLNLYYSYQQLAGGQQSYTSQDLISPGSAHPPVSSGTDVGSLAGWDYENINYQTLTTGFPPLLEAVDTVNHYLFNVAGNSTFNATLVWQRHANQDNINNLALFFYNTGSGVLVTSSVSMVDNVQHIYIPHLAPGTYDLEAVAFFSNSISLTETYALAFQIYPMSPPELSIALNGANAVMTWPWSPTVYTLQASASLSPANWINVTAPEWITNTTVWTAVGNSGGASYFRLVR